MTKNKEDKKLIDKSKINIANTEIFAVTKLGKSRPQSRKNCKNAL